MAANVRTENFRSGGVLLDASHLHEMRIPTRSAPHPGVIQNDLIWNSSSNIFGGTLTAQSVQKKKPPPRPPPPKFNPNHIQYQKDQKSKKPARPTELLTNFFGRKKQENIVSTHVSNELQNVTLQFANSIANPTTTISLIDLSPPGSPTFTTRSSSDGVSINSFGSDGNSNPSVFTSSGNISQTESTFEDDFDFFGLSAKKSVQNDSWQTKITQDPFRSLQNTCLNMSQNSSDMSNFPLKFNNCIATQVPSNQTVFKPLVASMPTIIRARPSKPPAIKIHPKKFEPVVKEACIENFKVSNSVIIKKPSTLDFKIPNNSTLNKQLTLDFSDTWSNDYNEDNPSPPMPNFPPPALPADYLVELNNDCKDSNKPYGIALYDFPATHPNDLPLKEGDVIQLIKIINEDWLEGRIGSHQGMFPLTFIDVKVPLPGLSDNIVTAIYAFQGENDDDLSFEEGAKIILISRISEDWLYGEYNGKKGQFPINYVNRLPYNI